MTTPITTPEEMLEAVKQVLSDRLSAYERNGETVTALWAISGARSTIELLRSRIAPPNPRQSTTYLLSAPCVWCGYNGEGFWQSGTHAATCPWHEVGGYTDRYDRLVNVVAPPAPPSLVFQSPCCAAWLEVKNGGWVRVLGNPPSGAGDPARK